MAWPASLRCRIWFGAKAPGYCWQRLLTCSLARKQGSEDYHDMFEELMS
jgi:hypothetical protein